MTDGSGEHAKECCRSVPLSYDNVLMDPSMRPAAAYADEISHCRGRPRKMLGRQMQERECRS